MAGRSSTPKRSTATATSESAWPVSSLKPNPHNPRTIHTEAFKCLVESIQRDPEFMRFRPIVVDGRKNILGGNMRYRACLEIGMTELPADWVVKATGLTKEQRRRFIIVDNAPEGMAGEWDWDILANEWDESELEALGFDLSDIEFGEEGTEGQTDPDDVPELDESEQPVSVQGEIYQLGRHRLLCGDATDADAVEKLLAGRAIDLMFTDPPYGVSYADKNKFLNAADKGNRIQDEIENDHLSLEDTARLWSAAFKAWAPHFGDHSAYYITAPQGGDQMMMMMMMSEAGIPCRHELIWLKNNHVLGHCDYNYKHEPILYGWAKRHKFYGGGEQKFSVWEYPKPTANKLHPTMKPVALIENAILNSTEGGMLVVDPFLGSGTTIISAEQTDRICFGMEVSPKYCDIIRRRWAEFVHGEGCDWQALTPQDS